MDTPLTPETPAPTPQPRTGLAIASLVLGILAVFSSILVVGAVVGLVAIVMGAIHISKRHGPNGMAWAGVALSVLSLILSLGLAIVYVKGFSAVRQEWTQMMDMPEMIEGVDPEFADWIGEELPEFTVTSLDREEFQSTELRGRRVVLDFWATWCPPCRQMIPHFIQLNDENTREELLIIGISSEDVATLQTFVQQEGVNYPIVSADDLPSPFDSIDAIPTTFFIDGNGRIQDVVVGYHDYDQLEALALAGDMVREPDETANDQP